MITIEDLKKKQSETSRLIGLDLGSKRIGVSICDEKQSIATPFKTINKTNTNELIEELKKLINEYDIKGIIIGNPINMDGSLGRSAQSVNDVSNNIDKAIAAGSKTGMYKNKQLRSNEIKVDADFFEIGLEPRHIIERERALEAKFTQNQDMKKVLMETQRAKLVQFHRGKDSVVDESLMKLRRKIA